MPKVDLYLGGEIGQWVVDQVDFSTVGCVVTTNPKIERLARERHSHVLLGNANQLTLDVSSLALSVHYERIIGSKLLERYDAMYNIHPGYLPWGRGWYPAFWAYLDNTPAGATIHQINARVDEGPIVHQIRVEASDTDTGGSLYMRVREAEKALFRLYWPRLVAGERFMTTPQPAGGNYHSKEDFQRAKRADFATLDGKHLVRLIAALSFPSYTGLEVSLGAEKYHIRLEKLP